MPNCCALAVSQCIISHGDVVLETTNSNTTCHSFAHELNMTLTNVRNSHEKGALFPNATNTVIQGGHFTVVNSLDGMVTTNLIPGREPHGVVLSSSSRRI